MLKYNKIEPGLVALYDIRPGKKTERVYSYNSGAHIGHYNYVIFFMRVMSRGFKQNIIWL